MKINPAFVSWKNPGRNNLRIRFTDLQVDMVLGSIFMIVSLTQKFLKRGQTKYGNNRFEVKPNIYYTGSVTQTKTTFEDCCTTDHELTRKHKKYDAVQ